MKRGALLSLFLRAYKLCDPQFLDVELKFRKDSVLKKAGQIFYYPDQRPEPEQLPTLCLLYNKTGLNMLMPILKSQNVRYICKQSNSIRSQHVNTNNSRIQNQDVGTYVVKDNNCNSMYIGEPDDH